jgi:hypothetical protein
VRAKKCILQSARVLEGVEPVLAFERETGRRVSLFCAHKAENPDDNNLIRRSVCISLRKHLKIREIVDTYTINFIIM